MGIDLSRKKIDAIYELRESVERKVRAEQAVETFPTPGAREALLDAQLTVEAKTQEAIELCHQCGHEHDPARPCGGEARPAKSSVVEVDFRSPEPPQAEA